MLVDMVLQESIRRLAATFLAGHQTLDVLIHNAAAFDYAQQQRAKTAEGIETIWATNHLGPVLLTNLLLDALRRSEQGRVLTVASKGLVLFPRLEVDLDDPEFEHRKWTVTRAYYQSKLAQVIYTYWLAERLAGTAITVNCVRVTNVRLDLRRYPGLSRLVRLAYAIKSRFAISPARMARTYTYLATSDEVRGTTGRCFDERNREVRTNRSTYDREHVARVMELTTRYLADLPPTRAEVSQLTPPPRKS
jgi:NAD(P)-dependent dehydrogenase (short-subunit alcohol dehydrogenase family)